MFGSKDIIEADLNKHFSRYEDPLWDDEENKLKCIQISRTSTKNFEKHSWKVIVNSKAVATIESSSLTKEQINFLMSPDGVNFLIQSYKKGNDDAIKIKQSLAAQ